MVLEVFKPRLPIKYSLLDYKGRGVILNDKTQNWKKKGKRLISMNSNNFISNTQLRTLHLTALHRSEDKIESSVCEAWTNKIVKHMKKGSFNFQKTFPSSRPLMAWRQMHI